jgi:2-methylisocitrate lyase-like PEP mutase family enzyme
MDPTLAAKAQRFVDLHHAPSAFLIANAWDVASARILEGLGFPALATSSGAAAALIGRRDGQLTRDEALGQAVAMAAATTIPLAGDLENGFGHTPEDAALTIRQAAEAGLVGGSIEDASNDPAHPIYAFNHAVERVAAAVEAARSVCKHELSAASARTSEVRRTSEVLAEAADSPCLHTGGRAGGPSWQPRGCAGWLVPPIAEGA